MTKENASKYEEVWWYLLALLPLLVSEISERGRICVRKPLLLTAAALFLLCTLISWMCR